MDDRTLTLIDRAREADSAAVDELFRRYRDPLRRALGKLLGDRYRLDVGDSEDAAHDAILNALGHLDRFEYRGSGSFLAWLLKQAEFQLLERLRARRAGKRTPAGGRVHALGDLGQDPAAADASVGGQIDRADALERIRACLDELPEREREIIYLRRYMELDMDAICVELGLTSPSAGRNLLARAQARLTGILAAQGLRQVLP